MSLTTAISTYWLGKNNIKNYNLLTLLNPLLILAALLILYFIFKKTALNTIYPAYYAGIGIVLLIGIAGLAEKETFRAFKIGSSEIKSLMRYGVSNEFNYLIQFLNYRLSYYFIARMLGLSQLGVFSIVVSVSEAVWIISRSMSAIHFSNVINSDDQLKSRHETIVFVKQSFLISSLVLALSVLIPQSVYQFVFGNEFGNVKTLIIYLLPGILAISVSNLFGHYFAGKGKLNVVRNKSLVGLIATLFLLPLLIRKYQLTGVCITLNISYILSSLYLWLSFRKEGKSGDLKTSG
jgi:O-antigen/teichoic acid export membrane protein